MQRIPFLLLILAWPGPVSGQPASGAVTESSGMMLVKRALAHELNAAQDASHPMRYELHKTSPHLATVKAIFETRDGGVAELLSVNGQPLSDADAKKEQDRLTALLNEPGKQRRRKQAEDADAARALNVLRALPDAFLYQDEGRGESAAGRVEKYAFKPNPKFMPPDLETEALTTMAGEIWIDPESERVVRLEGRLQQDVDFGWGILGRLNKGGWIQIEQADIGGGVWKVVHFEMTMSGRVFFKTRVFDTTEDETHFEALPVAMSYQKAIEMMRSERK